METFPIRPLFDRVIVREIPIEDYYEKTELMNDALLNDSRVKERSDRGVVVAIGKTVEEVQVGDTVQYDEYCLSDPIFLNPAHKNRPDLPKYWQIRVHDLKGVRNPGFSDAETRLTGELTPNTVEKILARVS